MQRETEADRILRERREQMVLRQEQESRRLDELRRQEEAQKPLLVKEIMAAIPVVLDLLEKLDYKYPRMLEIEWLEPIYEQRGLFGHKKVRVGEKAIGVKAAWFIGTWTRGYWESEFASGTHYGGIYLLSDGRLYLDTYQTDIDGRTDHHHKLFLDDGTVVYTLPDDNLFFRFGVCFQSSEQAEYYQLKWLLHDIMSLRGRLEEKLNK